MRAHRVTFGKYSHWRCSADFVFFDEMLFAGGQNSCGQNDDGGSATPAGSCQIQHRGGCKRCHGNSLRNLITVPLGVKRFPFWSYSDASQLAELKEFEPSPASLRCVDFEFAGLLEV